MEKTTMSRKEIKYSRVINEILNGLLKQKEAAEIYKSAFDRLKDYASAIDQKECLVSVIKIVESPEIAKHLMK